MIPSIRILARARGDIDRIFDWLNERSPQGAAAWYEALYDAIARIAEDPARHSLLSESIPRWNRRVHQSLFKTARGRRYRIVFELTQDEIRILRTSAQGSGQFNVEICLKIVVLTRFGVRTILDSDAELNLAYWSDGDAETWRYIVVPTTSRIIERLRVGGMSVFEALNQALCWVCDVALSGHVRECHRVDFESIPRDALPAAGTRLLPTFQHAIERQPL